MSKALKIELIVDDKGSVVMKQFGGNAEKALGKVKTHSKVGAAQAGKMERAWEKSMRHMKAHSQAYAAAGVAAVAAVAYAIKQFADASTEEFKNYDTAVTDMGKITDESFESIKSKIGSIGPKYGDATELTKAYYNVVSAGVADPVAKMDTLIESVKAAKAAHIESADTVMGITALMEAYGDKIKGASESADLLFQIEASGKTTVKELIPYIGELAGKSAALGITQDELGASFAQVTLLAGRTENAATQYKAILTSLMAPSEAMIALLDGYGGAQKAIKDIGFEGVLKLISDATGGNAAELTKLMGSAEAVGGMLALLGNDMAGYNQRIDDMAEKTGLADKAFSDWEKSMEGIESTYDASVKNIMIAFGEEIAPMVASSMQLLIDIAPKMISAIHTGFDFIQVSGISLVDQLTRGWIDLEYAFKTMVAGIEGAWSGGIDVIEEAFADFLVSVAAGLDKIPFFSDNATASLRELAIKVRANTDESEGFVTSIMKVQKEKEKELAAHNKIIDVMMAEALGYKETALQAANAAVKKEKAAQKIAKDSVKAAKESTKIYERLYDDVQKLNLDDYTYSLKLLAKRYTNYKDHLKSLGKQDSKYADGVMLLDRWLTGEKEKLHDDWARKHGTVLDRMSVRWKDYQKEAIDANRIMYDAIGAGAAEMEKQLSDNFFNVMTGNMDQVKFDWDAMWKSMLRSTTDHMAKIVTETALDKGAKAAAAGLDWLGGTMGWWAAGSWEIKKQHMAMLHPGEMVLPADMAEKVRVSASNNGNIGLGEPMTPEAVSTIPGSFRDVYTDTAINAAFASAVKGFSIRSALNVLTGVGMQVNPLGVIGTFLNAGVKGYMATQDAKQLYSMIYGENAPYNPNQNVNAAMQSLDWSGFDADMASKYGMMAINNPSYGRRSGSGGSSSGFGNQSQTGMSRSSNTSEGFGGTLARYGGIFSGPESGYPGPTMHGEEAVIPLKGGKVPVKMEGGGSGTTIHINGPLVSIEGDNHVFDDQFVEKLTRKVRTELRNLEELRH